MQELDWERELERWLMPMLGALANKKRAAWAPLYLRGLLLASGRKSVEPLAEQVAPGQTQQLHHFVSASNWPIEPLGAQLAARAQALLGGPRALLIIDDTALVKKGRHSACVAHQYCGELGKQANCQCLVSLTLARDEVPVPLALRLFVPEVWDQDTPRRAAAKLPNAVRHAPKWRLALEELDRVMAQGVSFGAVVADAGYGNTAAFRDGLTQRGLAWAVGVLPNLQVYEASVTLDFTPNAHGRPRKHAQPSVAACDARAAIAQLPARAWRTVSWRGGWKGPLRARFARVRIRVAQGARIAQGRRLPADADCWLICEERRGGERRYYLSNLPAEVAWLDLARAIKGRWACEQAHQQMKQQLGLDHYEGRNWLGLHHHALLVMLAFCFLQHLRLNQQKKR